MKVFGLAVLSFLLLLTLVDLDESGVLAKKGNQAKCPSKSKRGNKKQKKVSYTDSQTYNVSI
jgi:hypothetical protein